MKVRTVDGSRERLLFTLTSNEVDVAIMTSGEMDWDDRSLPLWSERVIVALPANYALADKSRILWSDLEKEKFLVPQHGPGPELEALIARLSVRRGQARLPATRA